jgi:hypothetical protein
VVHADCAADHLVEGEGIGDFACAGIAHALIGAAALAAAGATHIYLAGRPKAAEALQAAGVGTFVFAGCDVPAVLQGTHDVLGEIDIDSERLAAFGAEDKKLLEAIAALLAPRLARA